MPPGRSISSVLLMLALFVSALFFCGQSSATAGTRASDAAPLITPVDGFNQKSTLKKNVFTTPLSFLENRGQVHPQVKFYAKSPGQHIFFTRGNISFSLNKTKGGFNSDVARRAAPLTALWRKLIRSVEAPQIRI
jgi:hypothetical protein